MFLKDSSKEFNKGTSNSSMINDEDPPVNISCPVWFWITKVIGVSLKTSLSMTLTEDVPRNSMLQPNWTFIVGDDKFAISDLMFAENDLNLIFLSSVFADGLFRIILPSSLHSPDDEMSKRS